MLKKLEMRLDLNYSPWLVTTSLKPNLSRSSPRRPTSRVWRHNSTRRRSLVWYSRAKLTRLRRLTLRSPANLLATLRRFRNEGKVPLGRRVEITHLLKNRKFADLI